MNSRVLSSSHLAQTNLASLLLPLVAIANLIWIDSIVANDGCVQFDIPAFVPACEVTTEVELLNHQRRVELIIPISALVGCDDQKSVQQLMVRVHGLGSAFQIVDYAPKTQLYSEIDGPIAVETRKENKGSFGINGRATGLEAVQLSADVGTSQLNGTSQSFNKIPEQKLLLASGTLNRGNGIYFKFRHSPQTTLEGGHQIALTLQVPETWRGGMLRIDCQASGEEKYLLGKSEFNAGSQSFVVATYLKGNPDAQATVERYSSVESRYRLAAQEWQRRLNQKQKEDPIGNFLGQRVSKLPNGWQNRFMLLDSRSIESQIKPHLPVGMQNATSQFLLARKNVLRLSK